jgi:hypothetical protein
MASIFSGDPAEVASKFIIALLVESVSCAWTFNPIPRNKNKRILFIDNYTLRLKY